MNNMLSDLNNSFHQYVMKINVKKGKTVVIGKNVKCEIARQRSPECGLLQIFRIYYKQCNETLALS